MRVVGMVANIRPLKSPTLRSALFPAQDCRSSVGKGAADLVYVFLVHLLGLRQVEVSSAQKPETTITSQFDFQQIQSHKFVADLQFR